MHPHGSSHAKGHDLMLNRSTLLGIAAALLLSVHATAAETAKPTMDLEILANGQLLLRGELIDGIDDLEAKLRVMRQNEPPFELSIKLPKTFSFQSLSSVMKTLEDMGKNLGLMRDDRSKPAPIPLDSTI